MAVIASAVGAHEIFTRDPVLFTNIPGQMPLLDDMRLGSYERKASAVRPSRSLTAVSSADEDISFCPSSTWMGSRMDRPDTTAVDEGNTNMHAALRIRKWETLNDLTVKLAWLDDAYQCHSCDRDNSTPREAHGQDEVSHSDELDRINATSSSSSLTVVSTLSLDDVSSLGSSLGSGSTWTVSSLDDSESDCRSTATSIWSLHDYEPVLQTFEEDGRSFCIREKSKSRRVAARVCRAVRSMFMKIRRLKVSSTRVSWNCVRSSIIE